MKNGFYNNNRSYREKRKRWIKENKEYYAKWRKNNKDKIKKYNEYRRHHKSHEISNEEWEECLDYFDNSCAYCGMTNDECLEKFGKSLNKEHINHDGSNTIENCVPSCVSCNSQKREKSLDIFFTHEDTNNEIFSKERYISIINWIEMNN